MLIELVYDLIQYQWSLIPVEEELIKRGHEVFRSQTISDGQVPKHCAGSLGIQDIAYSIKALPTSPRFFLIHGSSASKEWELNFNIDYFLAPTEYWAIAAEQKIKLRNRHCKVIPNVGNPRIDKMLEVAKQRYVAREQIKKQYELDSRPMVMCFPTYKKIGGDQPWLRKVNYKDLIPKLVPHYNVFVLPHIMDTTDEFDNILPKQFVWRDHSIDRLALFVAADLIVSDASGAAYEACAIGTPVVLTEGVNKIENLYEDVDIGPVITPNTAVDIINHQLANPTEYQDRREYWSDYILGPRDGKASQRIVDAMEKICQ